VTRKCRSARIAPYTVPVGSIGFAEIAVVVVIALLVLGPDRLPGAARQVGQALAQLRNMSAGVKRDFEEALDGSDLRQTFDDIKSTVDELNPRRVVTEALSSASSSFTMASGDTVDVTTAPDGSVSVVGTSPTSSTSPTAIAGSAVPAPDADGFASSRVSSEPLEPAPDPFLKAFPTILRREDTPAPATPAGKFVDVLMDES
jgi:sec-independent protein translocase protein TatB